MDDKSCLPGGRTAFMVRIENPQILRQIHGVSRKNT